MKITPGLKNTLLAHSVLAIVPGLLFLLAPQGWESISGATLTEPFMYRLFGAALVGFGCSSWLAFKASSMDVVELVVKMEIIWTVLASIVIAVGVLQGAFPAFGWLNFALFVLFAIAFSTFYARRNSDGKTQEQSRPKQKTL